MASSLKSLMSHFENSTREAVVKAGQAAATQDWSGFQRVIERVSSLEVTASIANLVNTSRASMGEFVTKVEAEFDPRAIKLVFGGVAGGVGAAAFTEAVGLAAAIGISVLSVQVIALALIVLGLMLALPAIWSLALEKVGGMKLSF